MNIINYNILMYQLFIHRDETIHLIDIVNLKIHLLVQSFLYFFSKMK